MSVRPLEVPVAGLILDYTALALDPQDLGHDVDPDGQTEIHGDDGPLLIVDGYDPLDPDLLRGVAEWFDGLAAQATAAADELRRVALAICEDCDGRGVRLDDADCKRCGGTGSLA